MNKNELKGLLTLVVGIGTYINYVFPVMHTLFNPIAFWEKILMFFTVDLITMLLTLILISGIFAVLDGIYESFK